MSETNSDKEIDAAIRWAVSATHKSGGIFDKDLKRYVPMPREDRGSRFYVTPAGITITKKGR